MPHDPAILSRIAAPPHGSAPPPPSGHAAGQKPPDKPGGAAGDAPAAEPVALHDSAKATSEAFGSFKSAIDELISQVELSDTVDPKVEKLLVKCADVAEKLGEDLESAAEMLAAAREEHDELSKSDED